MKNNPKGHHKRHTPERSCLACRAKRAKKELIRLAGSAREVRIDLTGRETGRGAYLCPVRECWEAGLKGNRLEHALKVNLTLENRQVLVEYGESLSGRENQA